MLHLALRIDAITSALAAVLLLGGSQALASLLGTPIGLQVSLGLVLLVYAAALYVVDTRLLSPPAVWTVIAANSAWAVASLVVVIVGWLPLTTLGVVFVIAQAAAVAALANVQFTALRRAGSVL
jgi:hypothetical protein